MDSKPTPPPEVQAFIDEVAAVCAKHGMAIGSWDRDGLYIEYKQGDQYYGIGEPHGVWIHKISAKGASK